MEILLEIILGRIIGGFFGYYTLLFWYKLTRNKEGIKWLKSPPKDDADNFGGGCFIHIVGLVSATGIFIGIFKMLDFIDWLRFEYF